MLNGFCQGERFITFVWAAHPTCNSKGFDVKCFVCAARPDQETFKKQAETFKNMKNCERNQEALIKTTHLWTSFLNADTTQISNSSSSLRRGDILKCMLPLLADDYTCASPAADMLYIVVCFVVLHQPSASPGLEKLPNDMLELSKLAKTYSRANQIGVIRSTPTSLTSICFRQMNQSYKCKCMRRKAGSIRIHPGSFCLSSFESLASD